MVEVLMVCTGNICRSPIAAGLLEHYLPENLKAKVQVSSAGTHALHGHQAQEYAVEAMDKIGIDIRKHRARQVTERIARGSDLILTMEAAHCRRVKSLLSWRHDPPRMISEFNQLRSVHDIVDPYGHPLEAYESCIQTLMPCITGVVMWLGYKI